VKILLDGVSKADQKLRVVYSYTVREQLRNTIVRQIQHAASSSRFALSYRVQGKRPTAVPCRVLQCAAQDRTYFFRILGDGIEVPQKLEQSKMAIILCGPGPDSQHLECLLEKACASYGFIGVLNYSGRGRPQWAFRAKDLDGVGSIGEVDAEDVHGGVLLAQNPCDEAALSEAICGAALQYVLRGFSPACESAQAERAYVLNLVPDKPAHKVLPSFNSLLRLRRASVADLCRAPPTSPPAKAVAKVSGGDSGAGSDASSFRSRRSSVSEHRRHRLPKTQPNDRGGRLTPSGQVSPQKTLGMRLRQLAVAMSSPKSETEKPSDAELVELLYSDFSKLFAEILQKAQTGKRVYLEASSPKTTRRPSVNFVKMFVAKGKEPPAVSGANVLDKLREHRHQFVSPKLGGALVTLATVSGVSVRRARDEVEPGGNAILDLLIKHLKELSTLKQYASGNFIPVLGVFGSVLFPDCDQQTQCVDVLEALLGHREAAEDEGNGRFRILTPDAARRASMRDIMDDEWVRSLVVCAPGMPADAA
ncbi:hypothetical protein HK405_012404, partial [Cladochytrium tenue]